jgi:hypothetical protein
VISSVSGFLILLVCSNHGKVFRSCLARKFLLRSLLAVNRYVGRSMSFEIIKFKQLIKDFHGGQQSALSWHLRG